MFIDKQTTADISLVISAAFLQRLGGDLFVAQVIESLAGSPPSHDPHV